MAAPGAVSWLLVALRRRNEAHRYGGGAVAKNRLSASASSASDQVNDRGVDIACRIRCCNAVRIQKHLYEPNDRCRARPGVVPVDVEDRYRDERIADHEILASRPRYRIVGAADELERSGRRIGGNDRIAEVVRRMGETIHRIGGIRVSTGTRVGACVDIRRNADRTDAGNGDLNTTRNTLLIIGG